MRVSDLLRVAGATMALATIAVSVHAQSAVTFPGSDSALVGIVVRDLQTGRDIATQNPKTVMTPASTLKTVTAAASLSLRGSEARYVTSVYTMGNLSSDGTLDGDILIAASGDPTLASKHHDPDDTFTMAVVDAIKQAGIKTIAGNIVIDDSVMPWGGPPLQWNLEDLGFDYGAAPYAFNYADNVMLIYPSDGRTEPYNPEAEIVMSSLQPQGEVIKGYDSEVYYVPTRHEAKKDYAYCVPVSNPSDLFQYKLLDMLSQEGIEVEENGHDYWNEPTTLIYRYFSPSNAEILRSLVVRSDNMWAEATLRALSPGTLPDEALKVERKWLQDNRLDSPAIRLVDGSGLARANRVSPEFLANVLTFMAKSDCADDYVALFPKAGSEGTVKNFLKRTKLEGRAVLKTGSMNGILCYAGYVLNTAGKPTHAVVILVNGHYCSTADVKKGIENFLLKTVK